MFDNDRIRLQSQAIDLIRLAKNLIKESNNQHVDHETMDWLRNRALETIEDLDKRNKLETKLVHYHGCDNETFRNGICYTTIPNV